MSSKVFNVAFAVTPVATPLELENQFVPPLQALYVGSEGTLTVVAKNRSGEKSLVTFENMPAGSLLELAIYAVDDGSTADDLVGMY